MNNQALPLDAVPSHSETNLLQNLQAEMLLLQQTIQTLSYEVQALKAAAGQQTFSTQYAEELRRQTLQQRLSY